jgi:excisionase family DNA binding protein
MQTEIAQHALLTPTEAARYLGVSADTLSVWRCVGRYALPYIKTGSRVRYRREDLDAWLAKRTRGGGGERP